MNTKQTNSLDKKWNNAKSKIAHSDAAFGSIPKDVIKPGDILYSLRLDSWGAYGMGGDVAFLTICSRCGRIGGKNASAFGIMVTKIDRIDDSCDDCGVSLEELEELERVERERQAVSESYRENFKPY